MSLSKFTLPRFVFPGYLIVVAVFSFAAGAVADWRLNPTRRPSAEIPPGPSLLGARANAPVKPNLADLDVTYIERTPRYSRYCLANQDDLPKLCPGSENHKHWPDVGEEILYTAHVINKGTVSATGSATRAAADYRWLVNQKVIASGKLENLSPSQETKIQFKAKFPASPHTIRFELRPNIHIQEYTERNNVLVINSHDLTISYWVEKPLYDMFNNTRNLVGTYSFEDWIQAHFAKMNERFSQAKYPTAPNGITDRVRIDKLVVANQLDGDGTPMANDRDQLLIDGRWQSTDGDPTNNKGNGGGYKSYLDRFVGSIDYGLIHETAHQLGVIDPYRMNIKNDDPVESPNGGVRVNDLNGRQIPYADLNWPPNAGRGIVYNNPGIMGGGETSPYNDTTYFDIQTAGGMLSNTYKRRGFFGEYLYDTPLNSHIKVLDKFGEPLTNARVALYQKDFFTEDIDNTAEFTGTTDGNGVMDLPNRATNSSVTTATGHTMRANPFGKINISGQNGTMLLVVGKDNAEGYGFYRLYDLNDAYWSGNRNDATVEIKTNYPKVYATSTPPASPTATSPVAPPSPSSPVVPAEASASAPAPTVVSSDTTHNISPTPPPPATHSRPRPKSRSTR